MTRSALVAGAWLCLVGCKPDSGESPPPPPSLPATSASAKVDLCAGGGGQVKDALSAPFFARKVSTFCIDPASPEKTYGEGGKFSMDEVCTTAFDGECEVYKRFGLKRLVELRYIDSAGSASVDIKLSTFADAGGALGMYTKRVIADGDPAKATVKPLAAGGSGAMGTSNAYVWKGVYLIELTFNMEDPNATAAMMAKASEKITGAIAKEVGAKLTGETTFPSTSLLPQAGMLPLGVEFMPKDAFGVTNLGPTAIGYYQEGDKRYRFVAVTGDKAEVAKGAFQKLHAKSGVATVKDLGDEAFALVVDGANKTKADYVFARKGNVLLGIGDEEFAPEHAKLSRDDKLAKLKTALAAAAPALPKK